MGRLRDSAGRGMRRGSENDGRGTLAGQTTAAPFGACVAQGWKAAVGWDARAGRGQGGYRRRCALRMSSLEPQIPEIGAGPFPWAFRTRSEVSQIQSQPRWRSGQLGGWEGGQLTVS